MRNSIFTKLSGLLIFTTIFFVAKSNISAATEYQKCTQNSSCEVGEFLYDDLYAPIATASCTLTSRYPNNDIFINSAPMEVKSDGWYSYSVQATGSAGLYRSQICCTASSEYLCLDKTFVVESSSTSSSLTSDQVADAVWNAQRSDHTTAGSFGEALQNLVPSVNSISEAVWNHSSRNLTGFGSLIADLWGYSSRSVSSTSSTDPLGAKKTDIADLKKEVIYNQSLLEKLANKPVIQNYLEDEPDIDLDQKISMTQSLLSNLMIDSYTFDTELKQIDQSWVEVDNDQLLSAINDLARLNDEMIKSSSKIKDSWDIELASNIYTHTENFKKRITVIQDELTVDEKSRIGLEDIRSLSLSLNNMITTLGGPQDTATKDTLFGAIQEKKELADTYNAYLSDVDKLLNEWDKKTFTEKQQQSNQMAAKLATVNKLSRSTYFASTTYTEDPNKKLLNQVLTIQGNIQANRKLLAKKSNTAFSNSWLEIGSVVFKTLLTNPSTKISQEVPLKYYLPQEIAKENIIEIDEGLTTNYDIEKKQLYVEGKFTLGPSESKVVSVRVEDVWVISQSSIDSLRQRAEEIVKPLANTSYFGQSVTIKSNIDVALDKIEEKQKTSITPEAKIKNYYEAQIELKAIEEQLVKLEDMVTQSGSVGSLAGFVGGAQVLAVWGLIIVMVTGFVFLVVYMRILRGKESAGKTVVVKPTKEVTHKMDRKQMVKLVTLFAFLSVLSSVFTGLTVFKSTQQSQKTADQVASTTDKNEEPTQGMVMGANTEQQNATAEYPSATPTPKPGKTVTINQTPVGYLNVRKRPNSNSEVITKVYPKESYEYSEIQDGWYKIKLKDSTEGWVSNVYIRVDAKE